MKIRVNPKQQRANTFPWLYWVLRPQWDWHVCLTPTSLWQNLQPLFFFLLSCTSISCRAITITNDRTDGSGRSKKGGKVANRSQIGLEQLKTPSNFSDRKCKFQRYKYLTLESWLLAREGVPSKGKVAQKCSSALVCHGRREMLEGAVCSADLFNKSISMKNHIWIIFPRLTTDAVATKLFVVRSWWGTDDYNSVKKDAEWHT